MALNKVNVICIAGLSVIVFGCLNEPQPQCIERALSAILLTTGLGDDSKFSEDIYNPGACTVIDVYTISHTDERCDMAATFSYVGSHPLDAMGAFGIPTANMSSSEQEKISLSISKPAKAILKKCKFTN